jgi:hypothetical protein
MHCIPTCKDRQTNRKTERKERKTDKSKDEDSLKK